MSKVERLRDLGNGRRDLCMIDPRVLKIEPHFNPRNYRLPENRAHLDELKANIKIRGVQRPLDVRFDPQSESAIVVDGECRYRAVMELIKEGEEIESVPCVQVSGGNEVSRLELAITANTGKPLSKWEIGGAFQRLIGFGWDTGKIAERLGFQERFVKEAMEVADAPEDVKHLLSAGAVTPSLVQYHMKQSGENLSLTIRAKVEEAQRNGKKIAKRKKAEPKTSIWHVLREAWSTGKIEVNGKKHDLPDEVVLWIAMQIGEEKSS